jgi:hypothetical protein
LGEKRDKDLKRLDRARRCRKDDEGKQNGQARKSEERVLSGFNARSSMEKIPIVVEGAWICVKVQ